KSDGTLWAWGDNSVGQLGDGTFMQRNAPVQIGSSINWVSISCGYSHTLGIKSDGTLWAWGNNSSGQLGDGTTTQRNAPIQIGTLTNWVSISCGYSHTIGIKSDRGQFCATGFNIYGQLGDSTIISKSSFVCNTNTTLPVNLVGFEVKAIINGQQAIGKVLCTWETASELNNDYFEVQRSVDGSGFTSIGKVKGNGTSEIVHGYQFTDDVSTTLDMTILKQVQHDGTIYYRLKQVDFNGNSTLSEVRVIHFNQSENTNWNIYPNPAKNELHIETSTIEKLTAQVFDITGKQMMESYSFNTSINMNTSSLNGGIYFIRIADADGVVVKVQKVVVLR
ncbi:MAG: T9SS type A sorting domain-containing protein, partial [Bacteroidota bacterium]